VAALRDVSKLLYPAVCETVASLELDSKDAAAVKLAKEYARAIDELPDGKERTSALWHLGERLESLLAELGATPAARAAMKTGNTSGNAAVSKLDELRAARRA